MTTTTPDRQPSTPGQALRWAADRLDNIHVFSGSESRTLLCRWADELDAAPATYSLPAEPPETVAELWDRRGWRWERQQPYGWCRDGRHDDATWCRWPWFGLLDTRGPLSTVPPERTETPT